jgi:hypothetical protein
MRYAAAFAKGTAMTNPLLAELTHHAYLRTQLQAQFPDADDETLRDTLEGLTDLRAMLCHVIRSALEDRTLSEALRHRIEEMQARLRRLEHRVTVKRALVAQVMERAAIGPLVEADFSASLRAVPRPVVISDEAIIPAAFWVPQPPRLDRKALGDRLRDGVAIPGALLGNGGVSVSVRVR